MILHDFSIFWGFLVEFAPFSVSVGVEAMVAVFPHEGLPWIFQGARVSDDPRQRDLQISCESWRCVEAQDLKERDDRKMRHFLDQVSIV